METEADPPRFTTNRIKEARAKAIQDGNIALLTSGQLDDPRENSKRSKAWRSSLSLTDRQKQLNRLYDELAEDMGPEDVNEGETPTTTTMTSEEETSLPTSHVDDVSSRQLVHIQDVTATDADAMSTSKSFHYPKGNNGRALILPDQATAEELAKSNTPEESQLNLEEWKQDMPMSVIDEIDSLFRDDEEVKQKEAIFNKMNKDYIEKQARLENERVAAEKLMRETEDMDAVQAEEQARYMQHRKSSINGSGGATAATTTAGSRRVMKKSTSLNGNGSGGTIRMDPQDKNVTFQGREPMEHEKDVEGEEGEEDNVDEGPTTEEALLAAISSRKISRKINYDAMSTIFNDAGTFSMDMLEDYEPDKTFMDDML